MTEKISKICGQKNKDIVAEHVGTADEGIEGFSQLKAWKMKKRLAPRTTIDPPAAKKDQDGNLVTEKKLLENLYLETYVNRLKPNTIAPGLENLEKMKNYLFKLRYEISKLATVKEWSEDDLEEVLKTLKTTKLVIHMVMFLNYSSLEVQI